DGGDRAAMAGEIFHFRGRRAGVGGDRDRAEFDTGKPGQNSLDAIVEMDQHIFARLDAALDQAGGKRADAFVKLAIGPAPRRTFERRPDQEWMVAAALGAHPQQPRHVEPCEWSDNARRGLWVRHFSSRAALRRLLILLGSSSAIGRRNGQIGSWTPRSLPVIASEAKQSTSPLGDRWIASSLRSLAQTPRVCRRQ